MILFALCVVPPALLWVIFRVLMRLKTKRDALRALTLDLPSFTQKWAAALLLFGYALDFLVNVIHGTVLFLELPKELTVSARVSRHTHDVAVPAWYARPLVLYRRMVARFMRDRILKPYDPSGGHD